MIVWWFNTFTCRLLSFRTCVCVCVRVSVHMYYYVHVHVSVYVSIYVCVYVHVRVYRYVHDVAIRHPLCYDFDCVLIRYSASHPVKGYIPIRSRTLSIDSLSTLYSPFWSPLLTFYTPLYFSYLNREYQNPNTKISRFSCPVLYCTIFTCWSDTHESWSDHLVHPLTLTYLNVRN